MPHITLRQIRIFDSVSRYQSHTRAAEKLHMTQPAVSMQMKKLEENIGIDLFERHGKSINLSQSGEKLREYCTQIIQSYDKMIAFADKEKGNETGHLIISVATTANHFSTRILSAFSKKYPEVTISLDVTNRQRILQQLDNYEPDLVIMGEPPKGHGLKYEQFMSNPLVIIAPPDHPLIKKNKMIINDLNNQTFVVREKGSGTRETVERIFHEASVNWQSTMEMSSNEAIKHAVAAGFGLGVVSLHTLELEISNGHLAILDVEGFPLERHWHVVTREGKAVSPVALSFKNFLLKEAYKYMHHETLTRPNH